MTIDCKYRNKTVKTNTLLTFSDVEKSNQRLEERWKEIQEMHKSRVAKWKDLRENSDQVTFLIDIICLYVV
jgi:hypothetical protein